MKPEQDRGDGQTLRHNREQDDREDHADKQIALGHGRWKAQD